MVGRTGSGKSSLLLTLYRLINITGGEIRLDGADLLGMSLSAVRRKLAIIPQASLTSAPIQGNSQGVLSKTPIVPSEECRRLWEYWTALYMVHPTNLKSAV